MAGLNAPPSDKLQRQSKLWFKQRLYRLTASRFYDILHGGKPAKRRGRPTLPTHLEPHRLVWKEKKSPYVQEMLNWGIEREPHALTMVSRALGRDLLPAGFCISKQYSFIGGSPDAFIPSLKTGKPVGVVEVKCPYSVRVTGNRPPYVIICARDKTSYKLSTTSAYYYQLQGLLYVTDLKQAIFAAYTPLKTYIMRVERDDSFITWMVRQLVKYYSDIYYPYLEKQGLLSEIPESDKLALEKVRETNKQKQQEYRQS